MEMTPFPPLTEREFDVSTVDLVVDSLRNALESEVNNDKVGVPSNVQSMARDFYGSMLVSMIDY